MKTGPILLIGLTYLLSACSVSSIPAPVENVIVEPSVILEEPEPVVIRPDKHLIKGGETLHEIALNYGLEYQKIALWNGLNDPDRIYAGQILLLKPPDNEPKVSVVSKKSVIEEKAVTLPAASTVLSEDDGDGDKNPADLPVNVPIKKSPLAAKYIHSPKTLKKLLSQWRVNTEKKTQAPRKLPKEQPAAEDIAVRQARRRFDIDWIWPVKGKIENKFNERNKGIILSLNWVRRFMPARTAKWFMSAPALKVTGGWSLLNIKTIIYPLTPIIRKFWCAKGKLSNAASKSPLWATAVLQNPCYILK